MKAITEQRGDVIKGNISCRDIIGFFFLALIIRYYPHNREGHKNEGFEGKFFSHVFNQIV